LELISVPFSGHLFARVARGDCFLGVTTGSPTWASSVMKVLRDIGYRLRLRNGTVGSGMGPLASPTMNLIGDGAVPIPVQWPTAS
jgi:hypothetical protein